VQARLKNHVANDKDALLFPIADGSNESVELAKALEAALGTGPTPMLRPLPVTWRSSR
jgi:hypothetical protein